MQRLLVTLVTVFALAGCKEAGSTLAAQAQVTLAEEAAQTSLAPNLPPLPELFDCLREAGGVVVASHRGGPAPGYPENALETLEYGFEAGIRVFEIDVAESRDGVIFLHHDDRFGRTVAADGFVSDTRWAEIADRALKDNDGAVTRFHPPKLTDVLAWAKQRGAILELDRKGTTGWRNLIETVKAAGAQNNAVLISYSDEEAGAIAKLDPAMMMTASAQDSRDLGRLEALGVDRTRVIGWTGTREPDPSAFAQLLRQGVEPAFGTLGRKGARLDDQYWEDGDGSEYQRLVDDGVVLIATDEPYRVSEWLDADDTGWAACAAY
jgi:glycerophosphoryl diester phosphodiesterase